jgi:hypothetical protein
MSKSNLTKNSDHLMNNFGMILGVTWSMKSIVNLALEIRLAMLDDFAIYLKVMMLL